MAIKIVCDLCGNNGGKKFVKATISLQIYDWNHYAHIDNADVDTASTLTNSIVQHPIGRTFEVELCQHCDGTWLDRVRNITRISDPEGGK